MTAATPFRISHSCAADARQAAREFHAGVVQPDMSMVVFFCSSDYDLAALADELNQLFGSVPVIGCTTAGEIGAAGYRARSLSGVSFGAGAGAAVAGCLPDLAHFDVGRGQAFVRDLLHRLDEQPVKGSRAFALLPIRIFKAQHCVSESERLVVTEADAEQRVVKEINGLPAAEEYARVLGVAVDDLTPDHFAATPVVVVLDGTDYVRSIQKANPDGTLTFYCVIEEGIVLRVARGGDIYANLEQTFANLREEIGPPALTFGCDCILRNLEITQKQLKEPVGDLFRRNNTVGFSTYGEQYGGVHVNQTFTGIAIGSAAGENHD